MSRAIWAKPSPRSKLKYVVITSVDRDDLRDGGAQHFVDCIQASHAVNCRQTQIEVLVPDFRGRQVALQTFVNGLPDVMNHNLETVPRLYKAARPVPITPTRCSCCAFQATPRGCPTKSGIMVGLGETDEKSCRPYGTCATTTST